MSRRTKIIIGITLALLVIVGVLVWYFFFRTAAVPPPGAGGEFPGVGEEIDAPIDEPVVLPEGEPGVFRPILRQLSKEPVAGAVAGAKGKDTLVHYVERATGNVFEVLAQGGGEKRLTNTTIPKVHEAIWNKNGTSVILRYLKENSETIDTFSGTVKAAAGQAAGELVGSFFPSNIIELAASPDGTSVLYLRDEAGATELVRAAWSGAGKTRVWTSPLREWLILWQKQSTALIVSKPSVFANGLLLSLDLASGAESVLLRDIRGLTALPNHALTRVLISQSSNTGFSTRLMNRQTGGISEFPLTTLPEKCVFSKDDSDLYCAVPETVPLASYPDVWYQGLVSFQDEIWKIDSAGAASLIFSPSAEGAGLDAVKPLLSPDERFFVFVSKQDGILWSLQFKE